MQRQCTAQLAACNMGFRAKGIEPQVDVPQLPGFSFVIIVNPWLEASNFNVQTARKPKRVLNQLDSRGKPVNMHSLKA